MLQKNEIAVLDNDEAINLPLTPTVATVSTVSRLSLTVAAVPSMKAFFHRLHIGGSTKDKDRESSIQKEKFPPLRSWPPGEPQRATSTPNSFSAFKPLPELAPPQLSTSLSTRPLPPIGESPTSSLSQSPTPAYSSEPILSDSAHPLAPAPPSDQDSSARSSRKTAEAAPPVTTDVQKKVAFISPPLTPVNPDRALPDAPAAGLPSAALPLKTTLTRFQATHGKEPRGSISTTASSSKTDVGNTINRPTPKPASTRATSPYLNKHGEGPSAASLRSGTPYSQMSSSSGSRILAAQSWSEVTEEDLVSNLGSRERTRQEVLFEIISSEERSVVSSLALCTLLILTVDMYKN